jgi:hypothetical protein
MKFFYKKAKSEEFSTANQPLSIEIIDQFLHNAYKDIGLYINATQLRAEATGWWVGIDDNDPNIYHWFMAFRETPFGKKIIYSGTDGSREAIAEFRDLRVKLFTNSSLHYYSEASGPMQRLLERGGVPKVPADKAGKITGKECTPLSEFEYERMIGGSMHTKVMYGFPKAAFSFTSKLLLRPNAHSHNQLPDSSSR